MRERRARMTESGIVRSPRAGIERPYADDDNVCWCCSITVGPDDRRLALVSDPIHDHDHVVLVHADCARKRHLRIKVSA